MSSGFTFMSNLPGVQVCSQPANLLHMMLSVHKVELPPLVDRQRAQDRVIQNSRACSEFLRTHCHELVHLRDDVFDFRCDLFRRDSARQRHGGRLSAAWHVSEPGDNERAATVRPCRFRGERLACLEQPGESLDRSGVGQIQMLENLCAAPFARRTSRQFPGRKTRDGGSYFPLQSGEARVHARYLPLVIFQIECCRSPSNHPQL
jgi:hypothetical protein